MAKYVQGCVPFTVEVELINNLSSYIFYYENEPVGQQITTHTYAQPGQYWIRLDLSNSGGQQDSLPITVLPSPQPDFELFTCSNKKIEIKTDVYSPYKKFYIDFGDGSNITTVGDTSHIYSNFNASILIVKGLVDTTAFYNSPPNFSCGVIEEEIIPINGLTRADLSKVEVKEVNTGTKELQLSYVAQAGGTYKIEYSPNNTDSFISAGFTTDNSNFGIGNIDLENNFYCLRAISFDECAINKEAFISDTLCSINLKGTAAIGNNSLTWQTKNFDAFRLIRNGIPTFNGSQTFYNDPAIFCSHNYCYQITSISGESISEKVCLTALSTPETSTAIENVNLSVNNGQMLLNIHPPDSVSIRSFHITSPDLTLNIINKDTTFSYKNESCYKINYTDLCDFTPVAKEVCPIWLRSSEEEKNSFEWTSFTGWAQGVEYYEIEYLDEQGNILKSEKILRENSFIDETGPEGEQIKRYRVKATPVEKIFPPVYSNIVEIKNVPSLYLPNSFTPNGDGLNDTFGPKGKFIKKYKLQVYNEWGELIFVSNERQQEWDGSSKGRECPEGTYAYKITASDYLEKTFEQQGLVLLLRK